MYSYFQSNKYLVVILALAFISISFDNVGVYDGSKPVGKEDSVFQKKKPNNKKKVDYDAFFSKAKEPLPWIYFASLDWMSKIPDETRLNDISIPGTHDSGAMYKGGKITKTQSWTISYQLQAGIRYFDIRCRPVDSTFAIYHGLFRQNRMFDDVMDDMAAFLKEHPSETIVMRLKSESKPKKRSKPFQEIWDIYAERYKNILFHGENSNPAMKQVRGKVFLMCNADCSGYGMHYGDDSEIQDMYRITNKGIRLLLEKDVSSVIEKEELILESFAIADTSEGWVLNHLSGTEGMTPSNIARITNSLAQTYLKSFTEKRKVGVVIMDFPGERLIHQIIKTNINKECNCPEVTFRNESENSWVEFRLPEGNGGKVIGINAGTYNNFVFPKCYRVTWSNLVFRCNAFSCKWEKISGDWGTDSWCFSSKIKSPYVFTGDKEIKKKQ